MTRWRMLGCIAGEDGKVVFTQEQADTDIAGCKALHAEQVKEYGKDVVGDFPNLIGKPVFLSLVFEEHGVITGAVYFECGLEMCMLGCSARATATIKKAAPGLIKRFQDKGFRLLRTFIPKGAPIGIGKELRRTGFRNQDEMYEHFLLDMRTKETNRE